MIGIFVNENGVRYAYAIVHGYKTIETRNRNMLSALIGKRVAVIRTKRNCNPLVVGYVTIESCFFCKANDFGKIWKEHLIPTGSQYDCNNGRGKWCYRLSDAEKCDPFELPSSAIRHGRSWCEF